MSTVGMTHNEFSDDEIAAKKKAIFDAMGKRGQRMIQKQGYDLWNPFGDPKDPLDIRVDGSERTVDQLIREFLAQAGPEDPSNQYSQTAMELAMGVMNNTDSVRASFEFVHWYDALLEKEGRTLTFD
ncbi:hypothetical protein [Desulfoluna sp.]|uniref:hypothetical protein n=1 Tax=Desulfoluna sp. TaxID=2045199 RepID=UPI00261C22F9|nr:hypothetical protein [Desulfoluna sp.]